MGLGKTAQAIAACHALWRLGRVERGLLLVPASLKPQWLREWQLFSDAPVAVVDGLPAERARIYAEHKRGFLIVNYEQVRSDCDALVAWAADVVVLDEAQRMKTWSTKTALAIHRLQPPRRLALTGTPMENRLDELASIVSWIDDRALEPSWRLAPLHATHVDGSKAIAGARKLDELRARIAPVFLRRLRGDVLDQLPLRTDAHVPAPLTSAQRDAHAELDRPIIALVRIAQRRPLARAEFLRLMSLLTRQRIICNGLALAEFEERWAALKKTRATPALLDGLASPKLAAIRELVHNIAIVQGRKVVVFSQWRRMLELIEWACRDDLAGAGVRAVFFTGKERGQRRTHNLVDFHDDPQARVFLATDAGGVGLNLQHAAAACINVELPWNPAVLEQRVGRIHRNGQARPVDVFHVVSEGGIEARICDLVGDKRALFRGLFDGDREEVTFERSGGFLARLEQIIDAPGARQVDASATVVATAHQTTADVHKPAAAIDVTALFGALRVTPSADGGLSIRAPRDAAVALADLLRGVADMLSAAPMSTVRPRDRGPAGCAASPR
jgi:SNF2 family DNA or RNA helicase